MEIQYKVDKLTKEEKSMLDLLDTCYDDPILFSEFILKIIPDFQQIEVIKSLYDKKYVSVRSGRGCGKTTIACIIIWHFLITRAYSQIYITAPSGGSITGGIWPRMAEIYDQMDPIFKKDWDFQTKMVKHKRHPHNWFVMSRTARIGEPDAMAGSHAEHMMYVIDEASGVEDNMFKSITGSLTEDDNYLLLLSNPRKLKGFFFESHQYKMRHDYAQLHLNAEISPQVTTKSIDRWRNQYGEDSDEYKVEVLGDFPDIEEQSIIPFNLAIKAIENDLPEEDYEDIPIIWGLDVASSNDKSVLVKRQGPKIFSDILRWKFNDTMKVVDKVVEEYEKTPEELLPYRINVDTIGIGKGAYDRLKQKGLPVYQAIASKKAVAKKYIYNQKSEWWYEMKEWFRDPVDLPDDKDLLEEITGMRSTPSQDGRFRTEGKKKFIQRHGHSPDTGDAMSFTFCLKSKMHAKLITA